MAIIYGVRLSGLQAGQICQNVVHVRDQEGFTNTKVDITNKFFAGFIGQLRGLQCQHFAWTQIKVWKWYDEDDVPLETPISIGGSLPEVAQFANAVAMVFQKKTAVAGRRGSGRFYLGGVPGTQFVDGLWHENTLINMNSVRLSLNAQFTGASPGQHLNLVLVPKESEADEWIDITDFRGRNYPGTQVRRNFFRGN